MSVNINVVGRIATDVEYRTPYGRNEYLKFRFAVKDFEALDDKTSWFTVFAASERDVRLREYLKKGNRVNIIGRERLKFFQGSNGIVLNRDIIADRIDFIDNNNRDEIYGEKESDVKDKTIDRDDEIYRRITQEMKKDKEKEESKRKEEITSEASSYEDIENIDLPF